jgi:hypothetical protein
VRFDNVLSGNNWGFSMVHFLYEKIELIISKIAWYRKMYDKWFQSSDLFDIVIFLIALTSWSKIAMTNKSEQAFLIQRSASHFPSQKILSRVRQKSKSKSQSSTLIFVKPQMVV